MPRSSSCARPAEGAYLAHAAQLRAELEATCGFIAVERFQSLTDPDTLLSLSFFQG